MVIGAASAVSLLIISIFIGVVHIIRPAAEKRTNITGLDYSKSQVAQPEITQMLLTKNKNSRPGIALDKVQGVVIHYTANPGTDAKANRNYFESRKDCPDKSAYKVSSHYIIGLDGTIIQCIPEDEVAYASNDRNRDTISIECCHPDETGKFNDATYHSMVELCAWLCLKFDLNEEDVIRHYDVTGKNCPKYFVEHEDAWVQFKSDVGKKLKEYQ